MSAALDLMDLPRRVAELPPMPAALTEVLKALGDGHLSTLHCVALIEHDPALSARMLRLANSAFYGRAGSIGSISAAVSLLGLRTVAGVLTAASLRGSLQIDPRAGFSLERHWRHAVGSALACSSLAPALGLDPSEAFLAGLMHDIGQLIVVALAPEAWVEIRRLQAETGASIDTLERKMLGATHTELGEMVAQRWHFPSPIVRAIASPHGEWPADDTSPPTDLASLVQSTDPIVHALDNDPGDQGHLAVPPAVWQRLPIAVDDHAAYFQRLAHAVNDFCRHL